MPINKKYRNKSPQKGEAGFTLMEMVMVIVLASILGIFVFGVLTKCIVAQRDMQVRKEMSDDAVRSMDKVNRELREASVVYSAQPNQLFFKKSITSSTDPNLFVLYIRNPATHTLRRQSDADVTGFPWPFNPTIGNVIATNMKLFSATWGVGSRYTIQMEFESAPGANDGSEWVTYVLPRNL
ncbi:MAG: prepilin-type N-terminal cleavage/methylation domain-containing protein [Candidatus Scalindua rubra]|uniref:Prepilin-type N-terminal cleavage/methylation domain-containing protein n=1 Tax=Candidatus Scalindua brodae TaxID=237368 RepID=A0A0B0ETF4_9BACT|nr:MAG: hypothetical protein SCABRO_00275 [Candidatus Scalindua brodae]MBZ0109329.1 prepilin-type N-terminal cleavage/methylation domain-containing protein [Candidatus Scalindua rubra]TWU36757.1 hypothetical protein S225a_02470 [Candidatus Brocadiaceae bacterium S225]